MEAIYDKSFVWQMFFYRDQRRAKKSDTRAKMKEKTTVPETSAIRTFKEIRTMFSESWRIYQRGACMLHMLRSMLGDEAFFSSITNFFTENAYSSAVSRDLWRHLEEPAKKSGLLDAVNMTMQNMMEIWVNNSGFPEVNIVRNYESNTVTVYQYRLQWSWKANETEEAAMLWPLWITYHNPGSPSSAGGELLHT